MIDYSRALALSKHLQIFSQDTSCLQSWEMNAEQKQILAALCSKKRVITLKARQVGSTSVHAYYVALCAFATKNTPIAVVNYSHQESKAILLRIKSFLLQLGARFTTANTTELVLTNGSSITAITAVSSIDGESKAGRGRSYRVIFSSETAYYRDSEAVFASLSAALTSDGQLAMESTATPGQGVFRHTWDQAKEYTKLFFGVESHAAYQASPALISDTEYKEMQDRWKFSSRSHAAWWSNKLNTDLAGDESRALREYPVTEEHSWISANGRWINIDPPILPYTRDPLHNELKIYEQHNPAHYYVSAIDTALGAGGDDSVIVVYNTNTKKIAASYCHNGSPIDVVVELASVLHVRYKIKTFYIEANGIGTATVLLAQQKNLPVVKINTTASNRATGMLWAKQQINAGLAGDEQLQENCRSTMVEATKAGDKFSGKKDFLLALAFIGQMKLAWESARDTPPPKVYAPDAFKANDLIANALRNNRRSR